LRRFSTLELSSVLRLLIASRDFARRAPYLSRDEMQARQLERVRELVTHGYETVPFYHARYRDVAFEPGDLKRWEDFEKLPTVTKEDVIESYPERIVSTEYADANLIVSRSSGSSGKVLDVAYPASTLARYAVATIRMYGMGFDYRPWHRHLYVYTSRYPFDSIFGLYPLFFVSTLTPIPEILRKMIQVNPHLLVCYPSHLRQISEMASGAELQKIRPQLISVSSELSSQAERDELSSRFGCPVLDNYSSEEMARIAAQCLHKTHHVFEDMNVIEIVDESGVPTSGLGSVVATNLCNFASPLIRYEQNDFAEVSASECPCGRRFRALSNLQGRCNDSFRMPSGRVLTSGFLLDATYEFLLEERDAVRDFCLIQESSASVLLEIVAGKGWTGSVARRIERRFRGYLEPGVAFRVATVQECEKTRTGKRNPIICRVPLPWSSRDPSEPPTS
jgi:phenylacetate-CoA ligase